MAHKPDEVTATAKPNTFISHPEGQYAARCVDVINFGEKVETYPGKPERLVPKVGIVFRTGETNPETREYIDVMREFTVSMYETASLRAFLEAWRGKTYTEGEVEEGAPLHKLHGVPSLLTIEHKKSAKGRTYSNIKAISGLPKQMAAAAPSIEGYERPEYLEERKAAYAKEAQAYRAKVNAPSSKQSGDNGYEGFPSESDGSGDDLPFD